MKNQLAKLSGPLTTFIQCWQTGAYFWPKFKCLIPTKNRWTLINMILTYHNYQAKINAQFVEKFVEKIEKLYNFSILLKILRKIPSC